MSGIDYTNPSVHKSDLRRLEKYAETIAPDPLNVNQATVTSLDVTEIKDTTNDNIQLNTFMTCSEAITAQQLIANASVSAVSFNSIAPAVGGVVVLDIGGVSLPITSGGASGKHLPVRIGGVIYKIKLENN